MNFLSKLLRGLIIISGILLLTFFINATYAGVLIGPNTDSSLPSHETEHQYTSRFCSGCHMDDQGGWILGEHFFGGSSETYTFTADADAPPWIKTLKSPCTTGPAPIAGQTFRIAETFDKDEGPDWIGWHVTHNTPGWAWLERNGEYDGGSELGLPSFNGVHGEVVSDTETHFSFDPIIGSKTYNDASMLLEYIGGEGVDPCADIIVTQYPVIEEDINAPPVAQAGDDQTVSEGDLVTFDGSNSSDPDGSITEYQWDFGDNSTGSGSIANHTYIEDGTYTVTLTVVDNDGLTDSDTLTVTVQNAAPVVVAGEDQAANEGDNVDLSSTFSDSGSADTHTATIDWGDDSLPEAGTVDEEAGTVTGSHIYADNGTYTVEVTVEDDEGAFGSDTFEVVVANVAPIADAGEDQSALWGEEVSFSGSAIDPGVNDTLTYEWNFGDNTSASGQNVVHTYDNLGIYTVILKVTDNDGGVGEDILTVTVNKRQSSLTTTDAGADYSDTTFLSATLHSDLGAPLSGGMIDFSVDGVGAGGDLTDSSGTTTIAYLISQGLGTYPIDAGFAGDSHYLQSNASATLSVDKEEAALSYTGDALSSYGSTIQLSASVTEENDGGFGDITKAAPVEFELMNETGIIWTRTATTSELAPGIGEAATSISGLPTDVYTVVVKLSDNDYYRAPIVQSLLVVYNPEGGFVTGGGWIMNGGKKANFGFNAKYKNDLLNGEFNMIDRSNGAPVQIKSISLDWLVVRSETSASFTGKAAVNGQGSYDFIIDIEDNGSPGINSDTFNITVSNGYSASGTLSGGNIKIQVN